MPEETAEMEEETAENSPEEEETITLEENDELADDEMLDAEEDTDTTEE